MTNKTNKESFISEISEFTGLSEDSVKLLAYWKGERAISYQVDFINELIMKMPDYVFSKYKDLLAARSNESGKEGEIASNISENIKHFLTHHKEVSLSECKNYAMARRILPCSRERLKKIERELSRIR